MEEKIFLKFIKVEMGRNTFRNILIAIILLASVSVGIKKFNIDSFESPENIRNTAQLNQNVKEYNIDFDAHPAERKDLFVSIVSNILLPIIFITGLVYFFQNSENFGGGSGQSPMSLG